MLMHTNKYTLPCPNSYAAYLPLLLGIHEDYEKQETHFERGHPPYEFYMSFSKELKYNDILKNLVEVESVIITIKHWTVLFYTFQENQEKPAKAKDEGTRQKRTFDYV